MAAQRQYAKAKKQQRRSDGEVPEPFPPPTLKAEIYNVADYADVDAHAGKVWPPQLIHQCPLCPPSVSKDGSKRAVSNPQFDKRSVMLRIRAQL